MQKSNGNNNSFIFIFIVSQNQLVKVINVLNKKYGIPEFLDNEEPFVIDIEENKIISKRTELKYDYIPKGEVKHRLKSTYEFYGKLNEDFEDGRIRFKFDGVPSQEVRNILKSRGFKWSPSNKAWQRQNTPNGVYSAKKVIEELAQYEND